jgi:hypothetical protein
LEAIKRRAIPRWGHLAADVSLECFAERKIADKPGALASQSHANGYLNDSRLICSVVGRQQVLGASTMSTTTKESYRKSRRKSIAADCLSQ